MDYDDIDRFFDEHIHLMQHVSDTVIQGMGVKITYVEMKKESENINRQLNAMMEVSSVRQKNIMDYHSLKDFQELHKRSVLEPFEELSDFELEIIKEYFP